jgi:peptidoglycan/LPS O-acetylase OafA/YrhL
MRGKQGAVLDWLTRHIDLGHRTCGILMLTAPALTVPLSYFTFTLIEKPGIRLGAFASGGIIATGATGFVVK